MWMVVNEWYSLNEFVFLVFEIFRFGLISWMGECKFLVFVSDVFVGEKCGSMECVFLEKIRICLVLICGFF